MIQIKSPTVPFEWSSNVNGPSCVFEKYIPTVVALRCESCGNDRVDARLLRLFPERHACFFRKAPALSGVALSAGGNKIGPGVGSAAASRHNVIDGEM